MPNNNILKILRRVVFFIIIFFIFSSSTFAQKREMNLIKERKYDKAWGILKPKLKLEPENVVYKFLQAQIYSNKKFKYFDINKAHEYIKVTEEKFAEIKNKKELDKLLTYKVNKSNIQRVKINIIKTAFEKAKIDNIAQSWKEFLRDFNYPDNKYYKKAKTAYESTKFDKTNNSLESYLAFIEKYPESQYSKEAQDSVYSLCTKKQTVKQYEAFIKKYPENKNVEDAYKQIYSIMSWDGELSSLQKFQELYPEFPDTTKFFENDIKMAKFAWTLGLTESKSFKNAGPRLKKSSSPKIKICQNW